MSGRRRTSGGGGKKVLLWLLWGVPVLLLGANLVQYFLAQPAATAAVPAPDGAAPGGFITPTLLLTIGLWIPAVAALGSSALGLYWASKTYAQNERSSLLWARRGYAFSVVGTVGFLLAVFDNELFPRERLAVVAIAVLGGQSVFFGMLAYREYRRAAGESGGRRMRSKSSDALVPPPAAAPSAERPGAGG